MRKILNEKESMKKNKTKQKQNKTNMRNILN